MLWAKKNFEFRARVQKCHFGKKQHHTYKTDSVMYTVAEYSWFIANNFVIGFYCRCLEILCRIAFSNVANYYRSYRKK